MGYYLYHGLLWVVCVSQFIIIYLDFHNYVYHSLSQFIIIYLDCHNHEVEKLTEHKTTKVDVVSERKRC